MSDTVPISAIILTKNEAVNIRRCIESLRWCQEIIVVDSGSTDKTVPLAESLGAKVFTHIPPSPFQFAKQRNWALENCDIDTEWVLFLDADEVIPFELSCTIQQICSSPNNPYNAFSLTPRYLFLGKWMKHTLGYPNWHDRLLKNGEVFFEGGVWESFSNSARVGKITIPYDHYGNSKGLSEWIERHNRYSSWDAKCVFDFLETGKVESLITKRKVALRLLAARFWVFRPIVRFVQMYILRRGFLEGWQSLVFCLLYAFYELMTVVKIIELKRKEANLPL
jgi:glycosyltransferase involved in cell wall biosynthesis